ncbi:MAPK kinase substrate protein At1g80180-like [Phragmites australis]|uniref:MAPK kinase substrate protein At1g80180-like n=1 Tax=Phragmites australis TaxID=29695 RepID=UPI002D783CD7|nr:MAPK kinase substrate protein At1g80180-like [Phragmites australis]
MAGLQRSSETFRRSGSSGLVWEDKNFSGEFKPAAAVERSRSTGHEHGGYRAAGRVPPALDPPSPRVAVCGFCRLFGGGGKGKDGGKAKAKGRCH